MRIVMSSGHGLKIRGARGNPVPPQVDEVDECRRIVNRTAELLNAMEGVTCTTLHDDVSTTQDSNLAWIVNHHNALDRDLDVSCHLNAFDHNAHGTEVFFTSSDGQKVAKVVCDAICAATGYTNRGAKEGSLYFLSNTEEVAVLLECFFCDHTGDCQTYRNPEKFEAMCAAIASSLAGQEVQPGPEPEPPDADEEAIMDIALNSEIASYQWRDRGVAPPAYIQGFGLSYAQVIRAWRAGDAAAVEMAKADTGDDSVDALTVYEDEYEDINIDTSRDGIETLRGLYALLLGHGMRESSGKHCCGTDDTAAGACGRPADEIEAGLYQTSYNAHTCVAEFDMVTQDYEDGERDGYLDAFADGVVCDADDWRCYGSGDALRLPIDAARTIPPMLSRRVRWCCGTGAITTDQLCAKKLS